MTELSKEAHDRVKMTMAVNGLPQDAIDLIVLGTLFALEDKPDLDLDAERAALVADLRERGVIR